MASRGHENRCLKEAGRGLGGCRPCLPHHTHILPNEGKGNWAADFEPGVGGEQAVKRSKTLKYEQWSDNVRGGKSAFYQAESGSASNSKSKRQEIRPSRVKNIKARRSPMLATPNQNLQGEKRGRKSLDPRSHCPTLMP